MTNEHVIRRIKMTKTIKMVNDNKIVKKNSHAMKRENDFSFLEIKVFFFSLHTT